MKQNIVLSGPMFSGKSTVADLLVAQLGYRVVRARDVLRELAGGPLLSREDLQSFGAELEAGTAGSWLGVAAASVVSEQSVSVVVDAARTKLQLASVRELVGDVIHVHLVASRAVLEQRFGTREKDLIEASSLAKALDHEVERQTDELAALADMLLDTSTASPDALVRAIRRRLPLG